MRWEDAKIPAPASRSTEVTVLARAQKMKKRTKPLAEMLYQTESTKPLASHKQLADTELRVSSKDAAETENSTTSWLKDKVTIFLHHLEDKHAI